MKKWALTALIISQSCLSGMAAAAPANVGSLTLKINGIEDGKPIPAQFAYCKPDGKGQTTAADNISPDISWSGAPANTKSFALLVVDGDVPATFDTANKVGQTIPENFARQNFYHWVLVNIPARIHGLLEGKNSSGITAGGKPAGHTEYGTNGINGYGFGGYDGPCPPWNDERIHHYRFVVYALDIASVKLPEPIKGPLAEIAIAGHILAKGEVVGTYINNPALLKATENK